MLRQNLTTRRVLASLAVLLAFWAVASSLTMLRLRMVGYRPGQLVHHDIASRVRFESRNVERENEIKQQARETAPRVYRRTDAAFADLDQRLLKLPQLAATPEQLPGDLRMGEKEVAALREIAAQLDKLEQYRRWVRIYVDLLKKEADHGRLVVLPREERKRDLQVPERRFVKLQSADPGGSPLSVEIAQTYTATELERPVESIFEPLAQTVQGELAPAIAAYTARTLQPTHEINPELTAEEQRSAAERASLAPARRRIVEKTVLVPKDSYITQEQWRLLNEEQHAYIASMRSDHPMAWLRQHLGIAGAVLLLTIAMGAYVAVYQPRIVRNHIRGVAMAALLCAMLLVAQLAGMGTVPILVFGTGPTILAAMILAIVYEQRFAIGIGSLLGLMVTLALGQGMSFYLITWVGVLTCGFMLNDVRTRSKLVEVGAVTAVAMMLVAAATGAIDGEPLATIGQNCLHVGAAAMGVGFIVLGILPFIEKAFRITTSMTLLEWADASQPLLRRLAMEAPGTYNHSLQTATLAEAAADAIGAHSLLCRVGACYHDIGKINKADYFCENQFDGVNRHANLAPSVSLLVIIGHVKDGIELAREYRLPSVLMPFIAEHHGTTLVEYFYHQACKQSDGMDDSQISDVQYRYPGPKPSSREAAIVMIADIVESAARTIVEPTANRIESLVHELVMKRLLDGQFDQADITFAELEQVERSIMKTLVGIHHGRLTYPSTAAVTGGQTKSA